MLEKRFHNHYFNQTNPDPQPKPKTNFKKHPEKKRVHTGQSNNNQKEKNSKEGTLNSDAKIQNKTACYLVTEFHCYSHVYV
jgi:hypothetical protein